MIYDFNQETNFFKDKIFDYCIVGSGLAGSIISNNLILKNPKYKILLVEFGGRSFDHKIISTVFQKNKYINKSFVSGLGGSTNTWAGTLSIPNLEELKDLNITKETLDKYQAKVKKELNIHSPLSYKSNPIFKKNKNPLRAKNLLLTESYDLLINSYVQSIFSDKKKIKYLKIKSNNFKNSSKLFSKNFILCNNSYSIIQLLLNSINSKDLKINNINIGKNISNHPIINLGYFVNHNKYDLADYTINNDKNLYKGYRFFKKNKSHISFYRVDKMNLNIFIFYIKQLLKKILFLIKFKKDFKYLKIPFIFKNFFSIKYLIFMFIEIDNSVKYQTNLSNVKNQYGNYFLKLNFNYNFLKDFDFEYIYKKLKLDFNIEDINKSKNLLSFDTSHHMGGLLMGPKCSNSVIDFNFKYHNADNLYIISNGIFPNHGSINPSYLLILLCFIFVDKIFKKDEKTPKNI